MMALPNGHKEVSKWREVKRRRKAEAFRVHGSTVQWLEEGERKVSVSAKAATGFTIKRFAKWV